MYSIFITMLGCLPKSPLSKHGIRLSILRRWLVGPLRGTTSEHACRFGVTDLAGAYHWIRRKNHVRAPLPAPSTLPAYPRALRRLITGAGTVTAQSEHPDYRQRYFFIRCIPVVKALGGLSWKRLFSGVAFSECHDNSAQLSRLVT